MRNFKKVLSLVLCLAVMLSVMVVGAGAAFKDQDKIVNTEAVDMCVALNIINGYTDGSYKPEGNVTRAEMCKMICIALNGGKEPATATKATPTYSDIDGHWAEGYIEYCNAKGIVAGVGGGKFNPNGNVTASQAAKMLLIALGYNATVEKYVGASWELNVNVQANQDGLYKDLEKIDTSAALNRDNAAQMIWNALQAYVINKESSIDRTDGSITDSYVKSDKDLLSVQYKGIIKEGTLVAFDYNSKDAEWTYTIGEVKAVANEDEPAEQAAQTAYVAEGIEITSTTDYTALLGQNVKGVYKYDSNQKENIAYGIFAEDSEVLFSGLIGDLPSLAGSDDSFKVDGVKYKMDAGSVAATPVYFFQNEDVYVNGATDLNAYAGTVGGAKVTANDYQAFSAIDKDGDGKIDFIMVNPVAVEKIGYANKTEFKIDSTKYTIEDVTVYDGVAKNDWVVHTYAANTADDTDVFVKAELISGKITQKDAPDVYVDGTWYTIAAGYKADSATEVSSPSVGTTLTDAVVVNGYIFSADESGAKDITDYVVVVGQDRDAAYGDTVKLMFSDGTKKVVDLDSDQGSLTVGALYTYDTNKDGEYELTPASKNGTGFDYANVTGSVTAQKNSSSKAGYISNYAIADDAVIFVKYNVKNAGTANETASYKVITGATMKTMGVNVGNPAVPQFTVTYVLGTDNSKTGVGDVNMAYVTVNAATVKGNDSFYGYVTGVVETQNDDKEDVLKVTLWTATGEKTIQTVKVTNALKTALKISAVVEYTLDGDGYIDDAAVVGEKLAITSWDGAAMTFADTTRTARYEMDDDVEFIFIDDSEDAGVADMTSADIELADEPSTGVYVKNAYVVFDSSAPNDILLVVYDVDNEIDK